MLGNLEILGPFTLNDTTDVLIPLAALLASDLEHIVRRLSWIGLVGGLLRERERERRKSEGRERKEE